MAGSSESALRLRMVVLAAIAQNMTTGLLFGTFGTMLFALEQNLHADRGESTLAMSLAVVSLSLVAAWLGTRIGRISLRTAMIVGSLLSATGFLVLSLTQSLWLFWGSYLLLLGPGAGLAGVLAANSLAATWTPSEQQGRALGWVNAPLIVTLAPLAIAWLLPRVGLAGVFQILAICHLALVPLYLLVREPQTAVKAEGEAASDKPKLPRSLMVWLVLVVGIISGGGLLKLSHLIPLVTAQGHSFEKANLLLAISGGTGILGSLLLGWLADRIGPAKALALNAILQALSWGILLVPAHYALLVVDAVVVGICGGGLQATIGTLLGSLFGKPSFARTYGLLSLLTLPFLFGVPWLAGVLYVASDGYALPIILQIAAFIFAAIGALTLGQRQQTASV